MIRKMSEIMDDAYMEELLNLEPVLVDEAAIKRRTFEKLGLSQKNAPARAGSRRKEVPFVRPVRGGKPRRKAWKVTAIAVALMLVLSTAVYGATVIYSMVRQQVEYFEPAATVQTPVSGPTYYGALAMDIEQYNASVGQSVTDNGKTVTLDTIAVDDNFINVFLTIAYDEAIDLDAAFGGHNYPAYSQLRFAVPHFRIEVGGQYMNSGYSTLDEYDPYMADDKTVKMMIRQVVPTLLPNTFELTVIGEEYGTEVSYSPNGMNIVGSFRFDLTVDKSASAAATRAAQPGQYAMGNRTLDLNKLAITPFGAVLSVNGHTIDNPDAVPGPDGKGIDVIGDPAYLMPGSLYITDDKGNVLNSFWNGSMSSATPQYGIELIGAAADAESITLTPIKPKENWDDWERRTYSVNDIGAKLEVDSLSGYYLEDYVIEGGRVSLVLRPYGQCNYLTGGIVLEDDHVTLDGGRSGLVNEQIDRKTGLLTFSVDYYAATPEELAAIQTFTVHYEGVFELDEAAAITLPLTGTNE